MTRSLKRSTRRKLTRGLTASLLIAAAGSLWWAFYVTRPVYGLPFIAQFGLDSADKWTAFGGIWDVLGDSMRNDSNDRGAKLLTGSPRWKDYVIEGDVASLGEGSVGLLARVSEAEVGENSHKGYLAAVRTVDNSLILGSFDFAYHEAARVVLPEPVRPFRWYHVRLQAEGCQITAFAWDAEMHEAKTPPLNDPECFRSGLVGLRSNGAGGVWRNVRVLRPGAPPLLNTPLHHDLPSFNALAAQYAQLRSESAPANVQLINSLPNLPFVGSPRATVRGTVILTRPALYVEDVTGGLRVEVSTPLPLKVGDEVDVTGEVNLEGFSPVMQNGRVRLLQESVPVSPLVITASQAASGGYDNRLIQVEGRLQSLATGQHGESLLEIDSGTQLFHAILPRGRSQSHWKRLATGSRIRLRGVSTVDRAYNFAADPFVILTRAAEDVEVVNGPPWWRLSTLIMASLAALGLIFVMNHLYLRVKHWRFRALAEERERLANEIHDTLAQSFAGIGFQLQAIRNSMPHDGSPLERQLELAMVMTRTSHEEARRSIAKLHPRSLGPVGLLPALRDCAEKMVRNGGVTVETHGDVNTRTLPPHVRDTLYGIGQEAIANSVRHAEPKKITIGLEKTGSSICLSVEDDGKGFPSEGDYAGFGLSAMRKKAESISAGLAITSRPGAGTRVEVKAQTALSLSGMFGFPHLRFFS